MKKNKGITLIALIISIILLLILALVTIKAIQGEDDLFDYAQKAKFQTQVTQIAESLQVKKANMYLSNEGNYTPLINDNEFKLLKDITSEENAYLNLSDDFVRMYGSKLGIGKIKNDTEKVYYSSESTISEKEKAWLTEINVFEWTIENKNQNDGPEEDEKVGTLRRPTYASDTIDPMQQFLNNIIDEAEETKNSRIECLMEYFGVSSSEEFILAMQEMAVEYEMTEEEMWNSFIEENVGISNVYSYEDLAEKLDELEKKVVHPLVTLEWLASCGATKVKFKIGLPQDTSNVVDYSQEGNGSILGYVEGDTLYIASNSPIKPSTNGVYPMDSLFRALVPPGTTSIDLNNAFDTSDITEMDYMFYELDDLETLNLAGLDTSNVTNMRAMFAYCPKLKQLDLSGFNTSNVTNMDAMFTGNTDLASINLSSFNTEKVEEMENIFENCSSLTILDLESFNTTNITSITGMRNMFSGCTAMQHIYVSDKWVENGIEIYGPSYNLCPVVAELKDD